MTSSGNTFQSSQPIDFGDLDDYFSVLMPELDPSSDKPVNSAIASAHGVLFMFRRLSGHRQRAVDLALMNLPESLRPPGQDDIVRMSAEDILAMLIPLLAALPCFVESLGFLRDQLDLADREGSVLSLEAAREGESAEIVRKRGHAAVSNAGVSLQQVITLLDSVSHAVVEALSSPLIAGYLNNSRSELAKVCVAPTRWVPPSGDATAAGSGEES